MTSGSCLLSFWVHTTSIVKIGFALLMMSPTTTLAFVVSPRYAIGNEGISRGWSKRCSSVHVSTIHDGVEPQYGCQESSYRDEDNSTELRQLSGPTAQSPKTLEKSSFPYPALIDSLQNSTVSFGTDATRVFHGRGGMFKGCENVTLDWFPPVWVLTSYNVELSEGELLAFQRHLERSLYRANESIEPTERAPELNFVYQFRASNVSRSTVVSGGVPDHHIVYENGMQFVVQLLKGQNQGIFLDMRNGREWVLSQAAGRKVLNLFAYTCGFSVAAMMGGAAEVVNVDMARGALKTGQRNHQLNNVTSGARFLGHDIFKTWGKIHKLGPYGLIIVDPPSFQRNSFVAKTDYLKVIRRLPDNLLPNGLVLLCLNAPELDINWLKAQVEESAPDLEFIERLTNPASFPAEDQDRGLKVLVFQRVMMAE